MCASSSRILGSVRILDYELPGFYRKPFEQAGIAGCAEFELSAYRRVCFCEMR